MNEITPLEYRYALDAAMTVIGNKKAPIVQCQVAELVGEVKQRIHEINQGKEAEAALWVEPLMGSWEEELIQMAERLLIGGLLIVIASRPLAKILPERKGWDGDPIGVHPGGIRSLVRKIEEHDFLVEKEYGVHTIEAMAINQIGQIIARLGREDLGDRLEFAAMLRYCTGGALSLLSTVTILFANKKTKNGG